MSVRIDQSQQPADSNVLVTVPWHPEKRPDPWFASQFESDAAQAALRGAALRYLGLAPPEPNAPPKSDSPGAAPIGGEQLGIVTVTPGPYFDVPSPMRTETEAIYFEPHAAQIFRSPIERFFLRLWKQKTVVILLVLALNMGAQLQSALEFARDHLSQIYLIAAPAYAGVLPVPASAAPIEWLKFGIVAFAFVLLVIVLIWSLFGMGSRNARTAANASRAFFYLLSFLGGIVTGFAGAV